MVLSIFPYLLSYQQLAPLLLRLTLGVVFIFWAYRGFKDGVKGKNILYTIIEAIVGVLLFIGLFTQIAALVATIIFLAHLLFKVKNRAFLTNGINYYFILLVISLCLLLTGPGTMSFDLPL